MTFFLNYPNCYNSNRYHNATEVNLARLLTSTYVSPLLRVSDAAFSQVLHTCLPQMQSIAEIVKNLCDKAIDLSVSSITPRRLNSILDVDAPSANIFNLLNSEQSAALVSCTTFFWQWNEHKAGNCASLSLLCIVMHGGPGTGKSFFTRSLVEAASLDGLSVLCTAPTGIAAGFYFITNFMEFKNL